MRLLDAQQKEACESINSHDVVEVPLNGLIELANNCLRCINCLKTSLVLLFLGVHERQELKCQHLLLPVEVEGVVGVQSHE